MAREINLFYEPARAKGDGDSFHTGFRITIHAPLRSSPRAPSERSSLRCLAPAQILRTGVTPKWHSINYPARAVPPGLLHQMAFKRIPDKGGTSWPGQSHERANITMAPRTNRPCLWGVRARRRGFRSASENSYHARSPEPQPALPTEPTRRLQRHPKIPRRYSKQSKMNIYIYIYIYIYSTSKIGHHPFRRRG